MKFHAYREAGKVVRAKYAERKARHWLKRAMTLEARVAGPSERDIERKNRSGD